MREGRCVFWIVGWTFAGTGSRTLATRAVGALALCRTTHLPVCRAAMPLSEPGTPAILPTYAPSSTCVSPCAPLFITRVRAACSYTHRAFSNGLAPVLPHDTTPPSLPTNTTLRTVIRGLPFRCLRGMVVLGAFNVPGALVAWFPTPVLPLLIARAAPYLSATWVIALRCRRLAAAFCTV